MTIEKLIKYCLQYLEQDSEVDIMNSDLDALKEDDTFVGYIQNIEHSIYMGLTRYAASDVLMIAEKEFPSNSNTVEMTETKTKMCKHPDGTFIVDVNGNVITKNVTKPIYHKIHSVYAQDSKENLISNIDYFVVGKKVKLERYNPKLKYFVLYHPSINELDFYLEADDLLYDIELNDLNVTDEMAINIKYLVYSELKAEENPDLANVNKNYFETYLSSLESIQVFHNQNELLNNQSVDITVEGSSFSREWSEIYGD